VDTLIQFIKKNISWILCTCFIIILFFSLWSNITGSNQIRNLKQLNATATKRVTELQATIIESEKAIAGLTSQLNSAQKNLDVLNGQLSERDKIDSQLTSGNTDLEKSIDTVIGYNNAARKIITELLVK
jgi:septal ring factor EnvC (AmiA/AmiB activator)